MPNKLLKLLKKMLKLLKTYFNEKLVINMNIIYPCTDFYEILKKNGNVAMVAYGKQKNLPFYTKIQSLTT